MNSKKSCHCSNNKSNQGNSRLSSYCRNIYFLRIYTRLHNLGALYTLPLFCNSIQSVGYKPIQDSNTDIQLIDLFNSPPYPYSRPLLVKIMDPRLLMSQSLYVKFIIIWFGLKRIFRWSIFWKGEVTSLDLSADRLQRKFWRVRNYPNHVTEVCKFRNKSVFRQ